MDGVVYRALSTSHVLAVFFEDYSEQTLFSDILHGVSLSFGFTGLSYSTRLHCLLFMTTWADCM